MFWIIVFAICVAAFAYVIMNSRKPDGKFSLRHGLVALALAVLAAIAGLSGLAMDALK